MPSPITVERSHDGKPRLASFAKVARDGTVTVGLRVGSDDLTLQEAKAHMRAVKDAIEGLVRMQAFASGAFQEEPNPERQAGGGDGQVAQAAFMGASDR